MLVLIFSGLSVFSTSAAATPRIPGCSQVAAEQRTESLAELDKQWVEAQDAVLKTPAGAAAWARYEAKLQGTLSSLAKEKGKLVRHVVAARELEGKPQPTSAENLHPVTAVEIPGDVAKAGEIYDWLLRLDHFQSDRSSWIKWNIAVTERIRGTKVSSGKATYASMLATLKAMAVERGFPEKLLVLKSPKSDSDPFAQSPPLSLDGWRTMLRQGHLFIDSQFRDERRAGVGGEHTSISHLLQLLYVAERFQVLGYGKDFVSKRLMPELLGNTELVNRIKWFVDKDGKTVPANLSPWGLYFDAGEGMQFHPAHPEFLGLVSHSFAADIPYEDIARRERPNYNDSN